VRTEDLAKLGVMCLTGGSWGGEQLVPAWWINASTLPIVRNVGSVGPLTERHYGWLWWIDRGTDHNIYTAWGYGGQFIFCVPSLKLVVALHSLSEVNVTTASQRERAILDIIVNHIVPATTDRRVFTATGLEVPELDVVDDMVRDIMYDHEIRDSTVAITKDGRLVYARGFTLGEPEVVPVQPTSLFRIGSIGKPLTSIAIPQLIEDDLIGYDTLIQGTLDLQPLPGQQTDPWLDTVTVDHFLTHTGGMYSEDNIYVVGDKVAAAVGAGPPPTKDEISSYIVSRPFIFEPGTDWDYNNYGYMMLDMLLERLTGNSFVEYLLDNVFRPVGISRARQAHQLQSELAPTEVDYDGHEGNPYTSIMEAGTAPGGWVMAAPDMARAWSALFDFEDASSLVSAATREQMLALPFPASEQLGYGRGWFGETLLPYMGVSLGWLSDPDDGLPLYGHGGGGSGVSNLAFWRSDGIGFVMFSNKDPVVENVDFPQITVWPEHDLWQSVGVSLDSVGPSPTEASIPIVASAPGVGSSVWRSDVGLLNRSTLPNSVRLRLYQNEGFHDHEIELAPGEYRTMDDVMAAFGKTGSGPLRIFSSEPLTATSRTFNLAPNGTFGQFLGSTPPTQGLETGDSVVLMQLRQDGIFRSNIGITNGWKRPALLTIDLYDGDGSLVTTIDQEVPPERTVQLNQPFSNLGGRSDIRSGYAVVSVDFGQHILAYGSVADNVTDDPTTIPMKTGPGSAHQWVAAAAHNPGANNSQWRSDLCLLNLSGASASVELRFHADSGGTTILSVTLDDGEQRILSDVVGELGINGSGFLEIASSRPVLVSSRIYNESDDGTLGQFVDGQSGGDAMTAGDTVWLPQLRQDASFRTNIGMLNTGAEAAGITIRFFDASGEQLASRQRRLEPGDRLQMQEPFSSHAGRNDLQACYATVELRFGSGVLVYASVSDNSTNDPTTIPAQW
jgi:CubicO group peptidase (beta-lactamase class C family)